MKIICVTPVFVEFIPQQPESGKLYISDEYSIAVHLCCCGCGEKVVTPLSPVDWQYRIGPDGVSLSPSIGNWSYECRSHYFIRNNQVIWASGMSDKQIERVKQRDLADKHTYLAKRNAERNRSWVLKVIAYIKKCINGLFR